MVALICGKPFPPGARLIALRVIRRPLMSSWSLRLTTKFSRRLKKLARWKKLPLSVKVKFSVGRPAAPTPAPGGSDAADAVLDEPLEPELLELGVLELLEPGFSCKPPKDTFAACAALWT